MQHALLNETAWGEITRKRLARWRISKEAFLAEGNRVIDADRFGEWMRFVARFHIPVYKSKVIPYGTLVRLAGFTMVLAIRAKDEAEFLLFIAQELDNAEHVMKGLGQ